MYKVYLKQKPNECALKVRRVPSTPLIHKQGEVDLCMCMWMCVCLGDKEKGKAAKTQTDRRTAVQTNGRECEHKWNETNKNWNSNSMKELSSSQNFIGKLVTNTAYTHYHKWQRNKFLFVSFYKMFATCIVLFSSLSNRYKMGKMPSYIHRISFTFFFYYFSHCCCGFL